MGKPLEYFDGRADSPRPKTQFGTTTSFGIPDIDGQVAKVMKVPGDLSNKIGTSCAMGLRRMEAERRSTSIPYL